MREFPKTRVNMQSHPTHRTEPGCKAMKKRRRHTRISASAPWPLLRLSVENTRVRRWSRRKGRGDAAKKSRSTVMKRRAAIAGAVGRASRVCRALGWRRRRRRRRRQSGTSSWGWGHRRRRASATQIGGACFPSLSPLAAVGAADSALDLHIIGPGFRDTHFVAALTFA